MGISVLELQPWSLSILCNTMTKRKLAEEPPVPAKVAITLKSRPPVPAQPTPWMDPGDSDPHSHSAGDKMRRLIPWLRNCLPDFLTQVGGLAVKFGSCPPIADSGSRCGWLDLQLQKDMEPGQRREQRWQYRHV